MLIAHKRGWFGLGLTLAASLALADAPRPREIRVNCGGVQVTDRLGRVYEADAPFAEARGWGYVGGQMSMARSGTQIAGADDPALLASDRWGVDAYRFDLQPGVYRVTLSFAEFHFTEPGQRVFDVLVNGRPAIRDVDIVARAGRNRALVLATTLKTDDGRIDITARETADRAKFSAIAIEPAVADAAPPPVPGAPRVYPRAGAVGLEWEPVEADDLQGYVLYRRAGEAVDYARIADISADQSFHVDADLTNGVALSYRLATVDFFGNESAAGRAIDTAARDLASDDFIIGFDAGGRGATNDQGRAWSADRAYNPANAAGYLVAGRVATNAPSAPAPFRTGREGLWAYRFDVPPGIYRVTLGFHERAGAGAWDRVFDVYLNDFLAWPGLDLASQYGPGHAVELERVFRVGTEGLVVRAEKKHGLPTLAAIRVEPAEPDDLPPAAPATTRVEARDEVVCVEWPAVNEADVVGYRVLRAEKEPRAFVPVTNVPIGRPRYVDRAVRNGVAYHYQVAALDASGHESAYTATVTARPAMPDDEQLLDLVSRAAFQYFVHECDPKSFLTRDKNTAEEISVAAVGFGLSAYCVGAERGWMPRAEAERRVVRMLEALVTHEDNRHLGMFFHFLDPDGSHGGVGYEDGASTVDTALLAWGAIAAGEYFGGQAKKLADRLVAGVNWRAFADPSRKLVTMIYRPSNQKFDGHWDYYTDEALLVTLLGIGAAREAFRLEPECFFSFKRERKTYKGIPDIVCTWSGALFTYTFAHCWLDFRALGPDNPAALGLPEALRVDWWENTTKAARANREFCIAMARKYRTFGENAWGLTASSAPNDKYNVGGSPPCGDSANPGEGTLALYGAGMAVPFLPAEALAALRHYYTFRDEAGRKPLWRDEFDGGYGFVDAYNLDKDWFSKEVQAINHGPMLLLIENHRSGLLWRTALKSATVREALRRAGWTPPDR